MDALRNLFAVTDLRNRVLFTLGILAVYFHHEAVTGIATFDITRFQGLNMPLEVQKWVFGLKASFADVLPEASLISVVTLVAVVVLMRRVSAPMRV